MKNMCLKSAVIVCFIVFGCQIGSSYMLEEDGHCVMRGVCPVQGMPDGVACVDNGTASVMKDPEGKKLLDQYCPQYTKDYKVCCTMHQLKAIDGNFALPKQLFARCPSCYHNFVNLYCEMTCSPVQNKFLFVNKSVDDETKTRQSVSVLDYVLNPSFGNGLFNSCRDVQMPSTGQPAIGMMCGSTPYEQCDVYAWLGYMGDVSNGKTPFQINFYINVTKTEKNGSLVLHGMNRTIIPCSKALDNSSDPCSCQDCRAQCPDYFGPFYRTTQLIIRRTGNHSWVKHQLPPPFAGYVYWNPIYEQEFMFQVLDLQLEIESLTAEYQNETVGLEDICFKPVEPDNNNCTIESVMQYYQNSKVNLSKIAWDRYHVLVYADYLDHLQACVNNPASVDDGTKLHMSCLGINDSPNFPWVILGNFTGSNYRNASVFIITIIINNHVNDADNSKAKAWEKVFIDFMKNYSNPNMSIAFSSEVF